MTTDPRPDGNRTDPVCGMQVPPGPDPVRFKYENKTYFFCAETCRKAFSENPGKYLGSRRKGVWRRYLDRLNKATGGKPPSCCR
jgi:YHS domain-containing protein